MDDSPTDNLPVCSRRSFVWGAAGMFTASLAAVDAFVVEPNRLDVSHVDVPTPELPDALDGFTVAHVTDLHLGRQRGAHRGVLETLSANTPQLVALTGDAVEDFESLPTFDRFLDGLAALDTDVVAVHGNWEHDKLGDDLPRVETAYERRGIELLRNDHVALDSGCLVVGGDDPHTDHFDARACTAGLPEAPLGIFLVHAPGVLESQSADLPPFDLALAGHTHGGQIRLGPWAPITPPDSGRFVSGLYSTPGGPLYVSRGIGETALRARFFCPPELPYLTFRSPT